MNLRLGRGAALLVGLGCLAFAQVIEFESNGLKYQTLTKRGMTVMYARLPSHVRDFAILQVAVSNGSPGPYTIRPVDFNFVRADGTVLRAWPAREVVQLLIEKGGRNDVIKLVSAYEAALYGISKMKSTNGYETRRQAALAEVSSTKLKAAAAASAIAFVDTKLSTGQSTDGAIFFETAGKPLGEGHVVVRTNTDTFEFNLEVNRPAGP
ncbi:MAG TPA: hypothetical protein VG672_27070 [Bryobacteraceae bacterium]|jgi:hypothetical protein|nr:hypothetical protein [Bryobacteraceae bacterium]